METVTSYHEIRSAMTVADGRYRFYFKVGNSTVVTDNRFSRKPYGRGIKRFFAVAFRKCGKVFRSVIDKREGIFFAAYYQFTVNRSACQTFRHVLFCNRNGVARKNVINFFVCYQNFGKPARVAESYFIAFVCGGEAFLRRNARFCGLSEHYRSDVVNFRFGNAYRKHVVFSLFPKSIALVSFELFNKLSELINGAVIISQFVD